MMRREQRNQGAADELVAPVIKTCISRRYPVSCRGGGSAGSGSCSMTTGAATVKSQLGALALETAGQGCSDHWL